MNELFEKEGQSIFTFKKGDIIVRLKPVIKTQQKFNDNLGVYTDVATVTRQDNSFRTPYEFLGIENNTIYLRAPESTYVHRAYLEDFSEDWALFVVPDGLTLKDCI